MKKKNVVVPTPENIVTSYIGLGSTIDELSKQDLANIKMIVSSEEYQSLRRYFIMNSRDNYRLAGRSTDPHLSQISSFIGWFSEDIVLQLDKINTVEDSEENLDAYDDKSPQDKAPDLHDILE